MYIYNFNFDSINNKICTRELVKCQVTILL